MDRSGGVLYADGVGMGKTMIGLDLIREHVEQHGHHVLVVASAQLRDSMWRPELEKENLPARVVSYQELALERQLGGDRAVLNVPADTYRFVLVDEAHAYRNSDTSLVRSTLAADGWTGQEAGTAHRYAGQQRSLGPAQPISAVRADTMPLSPASRLVLPACSSSSAKPGRARVQGGRQQPDAPEPSPDRICSRCWTH